MKKSTLTLLGLFISLIFLAQSPEGFKYQAVVRNSSGIVVPNQSIGLQIRLRQGNAGGTPVYEESFAPTSNSYGLVNIAIGTGMVSLGTFANIDWGNGPYFVEIGMDISGGSSYTIMGSSQLMSVPYALYAKTAENAGVTYTAGTGISISGNIINNSAPDQVISISGTGSTSVTGTYPNFTISSTDNVDDLDADPNNEIELPIGGVNGQVLQTDGAGNYSWISSTGSDDQNISGSGLSGSILTIGIENGTNETVDLSSLNSGWGLNGNATVDSNFIGTTGFSDLNFRVNNTPAGKISSSGQNTFFGYQSGNQNIATGNSNTAIGYRVLASNTSGIGNTAVGRDALSSNLNGFENTALGTKTLESNIAGYHNTAIGAEALQSNDNGVFNTAIGALALRSNTSGWSNVAIGISSLEMNSSGNDNTAIGVNSLYYNNTGSGNCVIGYNTAKSNTTGFSNVAIGAKALYKNQTKSNLVAIGDSSLYSNTLGDGNTAVGSKTLFSNTTGYYNLALGSKALFSNTTGGSNIALGQRAMYNNVAGFRNIAIGSFSLETQTTGYQNIAMGESSLQFNNTGSDNIAIGFLSLGYNISGQGNTAIGSVTMGNNITGNFNTALGYLSLRKNNSGFSNVAIGAKALHENTTQSNLVAIGDSSMYNNTTGYNNSAIGSKSLFDNTSGYNNTATGSHVLFDNTTGHDNTANGYQALKNNLSGNYNTTFGKNSMFNVTTGSYNTAIGHSSYYNGNYTNSTALGDGTAITANNQVRLGHNVTSIGGQVGWSTVSDVRFKKDIQENVIGLDFILKLRPVTYHLDEDAIARLLNIPDKMRKPKSESLQGNILQTGFVAQEVEKAAQDLGYNFSGVDSPKNSSDFYGLRYSEFVVPLVKATQEQQAIIEKQQKEIDELKKLVQQLLNEK